MKELGKKSFTVKADLMAVLSGVKEMGDLTEPDSMALLELYQHLNSVKAEYHHLHISEGDEKKKLIMAKPDKNYSEEDPIDLEFFDYGRGQGLGYEVTMIYLLAEVE